MLKKKKGRKKKGLKKRKETRFRRFLCPYYRPGLVLGIFSHISMNPYSSSARWALLLHTHPFLLIAVKTEVTCVCKWHAEGHIASKLRFEPRAAWFHS